VGLVAGERRDALEDARRYARDFEGAVLAAQSQRCSVRSIGQTSARFRLAAVQETRGKAGVLWRFGSAGRMTVLCKLAI